MAPPKHSSPNRITVPTPNAQIAQQRRNNVDINKSYERLHKQFKKLSVKSSKQADELHALRAKTPKTEHHANALQRQIERLTSEKNQAEKKCKIANEARRKIEQKLAGGSGGQYLAEKYQALRTRTRALKTRCEEQAQVLESQENSLNKAAG
jgi:chromosome segregation ATPase